MCEIDDVRRRISDTDSNNYIFTDPQITAFIQDADDDCDEAAGRALLSLAADKSRLEDARRVYSIQIETKELATRLIELADKYFEMASKGKAGGKTVIQALKVPKESEWADDESQLERWDDYLEEVYDTEEDF